MTLLRTALRRIGRHPGYFASATASLSIATAFCLAAFSLLNALLFADVVGIHERWNLARVQWSGRAAALTPAEFELIERHRVDEFLSIAAQGDLMMPVRLPEGSTSALVAFASRDLFSTLGSIPLQGRLLGPADAAPGAPPVAVLSEILWRRAFNSEPILGESLIIGGQPFAVVGILPEKSPGLRPIDIGTKDSQYPQLFVPLSTSGLWKISPTAPWLAVAGRMTPDADLETLAPSMDRTTAILKTGTPSRNDAAIQVFRAGLNWRQDTGRAFLTSGLFLMMPLCIVAIACVNVVNLQLSRALDQAAELSTRLALGASRLAVIQVMVADALAVAVVATLLGWLGATRVLLWATQYVPFQPAIDSTVLVFTLLLVAVVFMLSGFLPTWFTSGRVIAAGLKSISGGRRGRVRTGLVAIQVAASVAAIGVSGTALRSVIGRQPVVSRDADRTLMVDLNLAHTRPESNWSSAFVSDVLRRIESDASTEATGVATFATSGGLIEFATVSDPPGMRRTARGGFVTSGWFDATGATLLAGRWPAATGDGRREGVVNGAFAASVSERPESVLGLVLRTNGNLQTVVVGVMSDTERGGDGSPVRMLFLPMPKSPPQSLTLVVRAHDVEHARAVTLAAIRETDPLVPIDSLPTLATRLREEHGGFKEAVMIGITLGMLTLLLAAGGLYSLLTYNVRCRTREIGVRTALGAPRSRIVWLVAAPGVVVAVAGGIVGVLGAWAGAIVIRSALLGISLFDAWSIVPVLALLLATSATAAVVPAYRATGIHPAAALRHE